VTIVGGEKHLPYRRPPLSKGYLAGQLGQEALAFRSADFYRAQDLTVVTDEYLTSAVVADDAGHGRAVGAGGRTYAFDRLALTVGGAPRRLPVPGEELAGVHYLRTLDDARALRDSLRDARDVVVVGGGFIGLEVAAHVSASGRRVAVVEATERLLGRAVAPVVSDFVHDVHTRRGTRFHLRTGVEAILGSQRVRQVALGDGTTIPADVVVVGIGMSPRVELAEHLGLECRNGIVVDTSGRTSIPSVLAAGDCTVVRDEAGDLTRLESVPNAIVQARTAAATMLGLPGPEPAVPWFWSDQADIKLKMAGSRSGYDHVVLRGNPEDEAFTAVYYRGEELVAVDSVNSARDFMAFRRLLDRGQSLPPAVAGDRAADLKSFLVAGAA
jgi:3-phenylpropionate/trans-cinnamate dioxygenase ferredoxin reductase subunit